MVARIAATKWPVGSMQTSRNPGTLMHSNLYEHGPAMYRPATSLPHWNTAIGPSTRAFLSHTVYGLGFGL